MSYLHIDNLYKNQDILQFKECFAMEKIHGTSAHIKIVGIEQILFGPAVSEEERKEKYPDKVEIKFFSGGEKHEKFMSLFNTKQLEEVFRKLNLNNITIYGEAYGGKQQGMRTTYGENLKFVAFEVRIGDKWLSVPQAEYFVKEFGLEFVDYEKISTGMDSINAQMLKPSTQAKRNGIMFNKKREGLVLRPLMELTKNNGERIISKHKNPEFEETKTQRKIIDPDKQRVWAEAKETAEEWVTPMRLSHVLDKIENPCMEIMREIIIAMIEDVKREGDTEIVWSKSLNSAIGKQTANLVKEYFSNKLKG